MLRSIARAALVLAVRTATHAPAADLDALKDTTPAERAKAQSAMMKTKLGLTDAEAAKVAPINNGLPVSPGYYYYLRAPFPFRGDDRARRVRAALGRRAHGRSSRISVRRSGFSRHRSGSVSFSSR